MPKAGPLKQKMKRTTVKVPEDLDSRLRHEAARRGTTVSDITREALEAYLGPRRRLSFEGLGHSGGGDIASRIEEILREEWGRRGPR